MCTSTPHNEKKHNIIVGITCRETAYGDGLAGKYRFHGLPFTEAGLDTNSGSSYLHLCSTLVMGAMQLTSTESYHAGKLKSDSFEYLHYLLHKMCTEFHTDIDHLRWLGVTAGQNWSSTPRRSQGSTKELEIEGS